MSDWIDIERFIISLVASGETPSAIKAALKLKYEWTDKQTNVAYKCIIK